MTSFFFLSGITNEDEGFFACELTDRDSAKQRQSVSILGIKIYNKPPLCCFGVLNKLKLIFKTHILYPYHHKIHHNITILIYKKAKCCFKKSCVIFVVDDYGDSGQGNTAEHSAISKIASKSTSEHMM